jgi:hypothetical protein
VINNATIGATTPSTGTFTTLTGGGGSANYGQLTGGATTKAVEFQTLGSDSNIALVLDTKGTGAIDLAAGSSGVNISNGGTVTAITRTATGSAYTGFPTVAITAPTTAGGVQATANSQLVAGTGTVVSGGTGYTLSDTLTVTTSGGSSAITLTVTGVTGGVVTSATANSSALTTIPSGTVSVSGGTGSGATFNLLYVVAATFTITAAGSGYVEQPTVTFSGGGGSGAAAYAIVGSVPKITSIGGDLSFFTPGGEGFRVSDNSASTVNYISARGDTSTGNTPTLAAAGASGTLNLRFTTKSSGSLLFYTNSSSSQQFSITHTASAVNYVQVTGATTASKVVAISAQGSDTDVTLSLSPKGAGTIRFGTHTGTILTPTGYITITDSGGTTRRLLVG